eukprot:6995831-Karenia_brevis.AAC.1
MLGHLTQNQLPNVKSSWMRKLLSRCVAYEEDFELFSLLYDISLAKQISSVVHVAEAQKIAPEEAAGGMQNFDTFWHREQEKLEDMCRQQRMRQERDPTFTQKATGLPNLYMT